ncbi:MAG: hypothetical protein BAA03_02045 [Caldibacillus debilis]|nr:MAG: hypothetical protein BAA03_02045 [Caldibacillus debilis]
MRPLRRKGIAAGFSFCSYADGSSYGDPRPRCRKRKGVNIRIEPVCRQKLPVYVMDGMALRRQNHF